MADRLLVACLPQVDQAEAGQSVGLADPVTYLSEQGQGLPSVCGSVLEAAQPKLNLAEIAEGAGLTAPVADVSAQD